MICKRKTFELFLEIEGKFCDALGLQAVWRQPEEGDFGTRMTDTIWQVETRDDI